MIAAGTAPPAVDDRAGPAASTVVAGAPLRRELGRLDTVLLLLSAMVVVDTIGAIAIAGAEAFTWLVVLFMTFFVPSALISAELGAALPEQGGVYVWVRRAFGRFPAALTSLLYWAGTPMWLGGSIAVIAMSVYERFIGDLSRPGTYLFGGVFVAVATTGAVIPLRRGKWIPTSGAIGQIVLLRSSPSPSSSTGSVTASTASASATSPRRTAGSSPSFRSCSTPSSASSSRRPPPKRYATHAATSRQPSPVPDWAKH